jgi:phenylacetate-CoA ligase
MDEVFRRYLEALGKTEWMLPEHLRNYQQGLLRQLVLHAHSQIPFYTKRLDCLLTPEGEIDLQRWNEVPVLTRTEAMAHSTEMRADELPATFGNIADHKTSGSDGAALYFTVNSLARFAYNGALTRLALWHGADPARQLAQIRIYRQDVVPQYPEGQTTKAWSWAAPDTDVFGLDMRTPVEEQIEWLLRHKAPYLMTLPSNAMALAYAVSPEVARALDFEIIFSISETVLPGARELIKAKLGAKLVGIYSCEEVGYIATECPVAAHYHICSEMAFVEIVDDAGLPVPAGQPGRVLVTGLYNYATPFIRYEIGDIAIASPEPCVCGRSLPVLSQVLGRTRHAFIFRDGKRIWPRVWNATAMQSFVPCREFQVVQMDFEQIEFRYVADGCGDVDIEGLRAYAKQHLHPTVEIAAIAVEKIPRGPGGKLDPFISNVVAP